MTRRGGPRLIDRIVAGPWVADALCAELVEAGERTIDDFFPDRGQSLEPARSVCRACPVRTPCLEYALATGEHFGVWGGKSERERRRIRRARRLAERARGAA